MDKVIDFIDEAGNTLIENVIFPLLSGTKELVKENEYIKYFLVFKTARIKNKISNFLQNIDSNLNEDIKDFINNLNNHEKSMFIESINKVMESDDDFQIYILSKLLISFKTNGKLNYWEKQLYYNIKSFTIDDFLTLYEFIEPLEKPIQIKMNYGTTVDSSDELNLIIKKFQNIGILSIYTGTFSPECINLDGYGRFKTAFSFYQYINDLIILIEDYRNNHST